MAASIGIGAALAALALIVLVRAGLLSWSGVALIVFAATLVVIALGPRTQGGHDAPDNYPVFRVVVSAFLVLAVGSLIVAATRSFRDRHRGS